MKFKLLHKLFLANISIILVLVLGLLGSSYYSSKSIFSDFIYNMEAKALANVANNLSHYYEKNNSWQGFINDKKIWHSTIISKLIETMPIAFVVPETTPKVNSIDMSAKVFLSVLEDLSGRISLLDADKNMIINAAVDSNNYVFKAIINNGKEVAWLRLSVFEIENLLAAEHYLRRQLNIIYWVGFIGLIAASLGSFYLSRSITAPIEKINQGTKKLASRKFELHIDVKTNDELQDLAENFNQIAKELSRYEVRQKQWIMDISHELRTPLTILQGEFEAISDGVSHFDRTTITSLKEEVHHISRLVNDLHELSVTDTLEFDYQHEDVDIYLLLTNYLQRYQSKLSNTGIVVYADVEAAKVIVAGDVYRLAQVIKNILDNSVRYIKSPGCLWIEARQLDNELQLEFHDSGPGVSDEAITKLFDRLYRSELSRNRNTGGSGVGLAICRNIITAHKGQIFASQSPKGGLCINIHLPFTKQRA